MATKPNVKSFQDMPPPGGYPEIPYKKGSRNRGPAGWFMWSMVGLGMIYGLYQVGKTNQLRGRLKKERRENRMGVVPFLMAESDRFHYRVIVKQLKEEAEIMKNVEGWKVGESVYSKRYSPPQFRNKFDDDNL
eukprot:gene275-294_t